LPAHTEKTFTVGLSLGRDLVTTKPPFIHSRIGCMHQIKSRDWSTACHTLCYHTLIVYQVCRDVTLRIINTFQQLVTYSRTVRGLKTEVIYCVP